MEKTMTKPRIAVIGSGISGLSAAWLLRNSADIILYEADKRYGGHTHTYDVQELSTHVPIDTGFMVFNHENYPNLVKLFQHLDIGSYPTEMSFSVSLDDGDYEYAGSGINSLFGQRSNLLRPGHWRMLRDILRFNEAATLQLDLVNDSISIGEFLDREKLGDEFRHHYLYPMAAAIWSCPRQAMHEFPAARFIRFFANHGLLSVNNHPQWYTVEGGSKSYLQRMLTDLGPRCRNNCKIETIERRENEVIVRVDGVGLKYDQVILACHADQALALLKNPSSTETEALKAIPYQSNRVLLHTDRSLMPARKRVWSSWNFFGNTGAQDDSSAVSVTYWMNSLQRLNTQQDYFVSLNPGTEPAKHTIIEEFQYDHPMFGSTALTAQKLIGSIQGQQRTWFCGAWTGYGFHEDGLRSGMKVASMLGAPIPWESPMDLSEATAQQTTSLRAA
jgi:predicted NAD/FAD-binding protein